MIRFKNYFLINEVTESKRNVAEMVRLYGVDEATAKDLIARFNKLVAYMDPTDETYSDAGCIESSDVKDIFSHGRGCHRKGPVSTIQRSHDQSLALASLEVALEYADENRRLKTTSKDRKDEINAGVKQDTFFLETECGTVYRPETHEQSRELTAHGNTCAWCTASQDPHIFKDYINRGINLFYFIPKDTPCGKEVPRGNRNSGFYAIALDKESPERMDWSRAEGFDEDDHSIGPDFVLDTFKLSEEQRTQILAYAPDYMDTLESLVNHAADTVQREDNKGGGAYSKNPELEKLYDHLSEGQYPRLKSKFNLHTDQDVLKQIEAFRKQGTLDNTFNTLPTDPSSLLWVINSKYNPGRSKGWEEAFLKILTTHKDLYMWMYGGGSAEKGDEADAKRREFLGKEYQLQKLFNPGFQDDFRDPHEDDDIKLKHLAKYIETRMDGVWPELERVILNSEGAMLNKIMQGAMKAVVYGRKSRWKEYENFMIDHFKELQANPKWKYKGKDDIDRSHEPALWNGSIERAQVYNTWVGKSIGHSNWKDYKAFIPETGEHLENIDDWPMEDPPLTAQAKRLVPQEELEGERSDMDKYIDNL
jgi:hypothetical protein